MQQHAGPELVVVALQGALELLAEIDRAVLDDYGTDRQHHIFVQVQPGGFQVHHYPALLTQAAVVEYRGVGQLLQLSLLFGGQRRAGRAQPGEQAHSWYLRLRLLCRRWAWRRDSRRMRRSR
ncbi:hypothetical protein D3C73_1263310 [compost metagenome]